MTKQCVDKPQNCGTCKWWNIEHQFMSGSIDNPFTKAKCLVTLPDCVEKSKSMFSNQGQDCPMWLGTTTSYEEKKE